MKFNLQSFVHWVGSLLRPLCSVLWKFWSRSRLADSPSGRSEFESRKSNGPGRLIALEAYFQKESSMRPRSLTGFIVRSCKPCLANAISTSVSFGSVRRICNNHICSGSWIPQKSSRCSARWMRGTAEELFADTNSLNCSPSTCQTAWLLVSHPCRMCLPFSRWLSIISAAVLTVAVLM